MLVMLFFILHTMIKKYVLILIGLLASLHLWAQSDEIRKILESDVFRHASVGLVVHDLESGEDVISHNGDLALIPASTLKFVTTFSAVEIFGEDHTFMTEIYTQGEVLSDGSLYGDIVVIGSGDPTLGSPRFDKAKSHDEVYSLIKKSLQEKNIRCIEGSIRVEQSIYNDAPVNPTWQWNDLSNYYASGLWPFNFHENYFKINFNRSNEPFRPTTIASVAPSIPYLSIESKVITGPLGSGDNAYVYSNPYSENLEVNGTIPPGKSSFSIKAANPNPAKFFIEDLSSYLESYGIIVQNRRSHITTDSSKELLLPIKSPTISEIVKETNLVSNNLYAESLLKYIGLKNKKTSSTLEGIEALENLLTQIKVEKSSLSLKDGSGLSNRNRLSTNLLIDFITYFYENRGLLFFEKHLANKSSKYYKNVFGNLSNNSNVYFKSGSMSEVLGYCGILEKGEKLYAVSFISNGHKKGNQSIRISFVDVLKFLPSQ